MITQPLDQITASTERRHTQRKKFRANIEIEWGSAVLQGNARDIGQQGLFIELKPPLWVGARFDARLMLNPVLLLECTVVRVEPNIGIAVTFVTSTEGGKKQLESLLVSLPAV